MTRSSALLLLVVVGLLGCGDPEPDVSGGFGAVEARQITLSGAPRSAGGSPFAGPAITHRDLLRQVDAVVEADTAKGLLVVVEPFGGALAGAEETASAVRAVRDAGKPVHCYFEQADNASYLFMAQACDRIAMSPAGTLNLVGLAAHAFYASDLLSSLGVSAEILAMGRYKNAGEVLSEREMPESTREALDALLDDLHAVLTESVAARIGEDVAAARARIDGGPYGSRAALEAGLIDAVEFDDESREHLRVAADAPRVRNVSLIQQAPPPGLFDLLAALGGQSEPEEPIRQPHLAVLHVSGPIVDGDRALPGRSVSGPFIAEARALARDADVRAVLLRIDSPGGSALASDRMWHAVRMLARKKPVIVSLGDVAASGGYYIASAGTKVFAADASLVGSIGVIFGKVSFAEAARRVGVEPVILERGAHAAWASPLRPLGEEERAHLTRYLVATYDRFIHRVATGRGRPAAEVRAVAEGRVYSGRAFRALGMIDEEGGFDAALRAALAAGDLPEDAPIREWPETQGLLESIAESVAGGQARALATRFYGQSVPAPLSYAVDLADMLEAADRPLATLPFSLEIR